jgi:hypothetical protein
VTHGDHTATLTCWSGRCSLVNATISGETTSWRWRSMWSPSARALGLDAYGLAPGCSGDLVLVATETLAEAVAQRPGRRTAAKRGRMVAREGVTVF